MTSTIKVSPFKIEITNEKLDELKLAVKHSKIAKQVYDNSGNTYYGVTRDWIIKARDRWLDGFDWKKQENRINAFSQFVASVPRPNNKGNFDLHFIHERSSSPTARTLLLLHGWPGSYLEFLDLIDILKKTGEYNIIAPSMPGYAFSQSPPVDEEFGKEDVADLFHALVTGLGYEQYAIQAGDWGASILRIIAVKNPNSVRCVHLNFIPVGPPDGNITKPDLSSLTPVEKKNAMNSMKFLGEGRGYSEMHRTRPGTLGLVVGSSPIALLAWIGEKFLEWSDLDPDVDEILAATTLWWVTETFESSIYGYRDATGKADNPAWFIKTPTAYSSFAKELVISPKIWAEHSANITWYKYHEKGGHFAAMEVPDALAEDIVEFLNQEWKV
ncbi:alpha/beta-hydrolase [Meredithblackwellia eburnea MCA 4105]